MQSNLPEEEREVQAKLLPPLPPNVHYVWHENECYDWGTLGWLLNCGLVRFSISLSPLIVSLFTLQSLHHVMCMDGWFGLGQVQIRAFTCIAWFDLEPSWVFGSRVQGVRPTLSQQGGVQGRSIFQTHESQPKAWATTFCGVPLQLL